ncbi:response regulator transcription factor [Alteromonadaceae bacterium BrNp21-10]|nr:response regulator transcription factor [Alteromonadaceae bacterium BrNp21-10]
MQARVIIADDHPLFRAAMQQALHSELSGEIIETANFAETLACLQQQSSIELVFLDLNMPGNQGFTGLTTICNNFPDVQVIMVSAEEDPRIIRRAIDFGASGYIPKSASLELISEAVKQVLDGEQWLPQEVQAVVASIDNPTDKNFARKLEQLTPHQFKVLKLMADGLLNKQIAYELKVQETTIKQHVSAVLRKLEVINRTQAGVVFRQIMGE